MTEQETQQVQTVLRPVARRKKSPMKPDAVMLNDGERKTLDAKHWMPNTGCRRRGARTVPAGLIREAVQRVWLKKSEARAGRR